MGAQSAATNFFRLPSRESLYRRNQRGGCTVPPSSNMRRRVSTCHAASHDSTQRHTVATPIHRCPSLRLLTCIIGNEILSGMVDCCRRSKPAVCTHWSESGCIRIFASNMLCVSLLSVPSIVARLDSREYLPFCRFLNIHFCTFLSLCMYTFIHSCSRIYVYLYMQCVYV